MSSTPSIQQSSAASMNTSSDSSPSLRSRSFENCPICAGEIRTLYTQLPDLYDGVPDVFDVCECSQCGLAFSNPQPQDNLHLLYPETYLSTAPNTTQELSLVQKAERWYREDQSAFDFHLFEKASGKALSKLDSYADLGCGTGDRVAYVYNSGCRRSVGVDPFDFFSAMQPKDSFFIKSPIEKYKPENGVELVSLFHVLEHVSDPQAVLEHVVRHIAQPGGYVFIQVPNFASLERRMFRSSWSALDIPRHFWHFRPKVVQALLEALGCRILLCSERNAALHPVTTISSLWRDAHIQRVWIKSQQSPSLYWTLMKLLWMAGTVLSIPWNIVLNLLGSATMLSIVAQTPTRSQSQSIDRT